MLRRKEALQTKETLWMLIVVCCGLGGSCTHARTSETAATSIVIAYPAVGNIDGYGLGRGVGRGVGTLLGMAVGTGLGDGVGRVVGRLLGRAVGM